MCEWKPDFDSLDERVTKVEADIAAMRYETRTALDGVATSITTLSQQLANMDKRIVEEKERWGVVLRSIVKWTARALLLTAAAAAGVNLARPFIN